MQRVSGRWNCAKLHSELKYAGRNGMKAKLDCRFIVFFCSSMRLQRNRSAHSRTRTTTKSCGSAPGGVLEAIDVDGALVRGHDEVVGSGREGDAVDLGPVHAAPQFLHALPSLRIEHADQRPLLASANKETYIEKEREREQRETFSEAVASRVPSMLRAICERLFVCAVIGCGFFES